MHMRALRLRKGLLQTPSHRRALFFPSLRAWHRPAVSKWPLIEGASSPILRPSRCPADSPWQLLLFQRLYRESLQVSPPARGLPVKGSLRRHRGAGSERGAAHGAGTMGAPLNGRPRRRPARARFRGGACRPGGGRGARCPAAGLPLPASPLPCSHTPGLPGLPPASGMAHWTPRPARWRPERSHPAHGAAVRPAALRPLFNLIKTSSALRSGARPRGCRPGGGAYALREPRPAPPRVGPGQTGLREAKRGQPPPGPEATR